MKILLAATVLLACGILMAQGSLLEFQKMIRKVTGKNPILDYSAYGCYCGVGGKGRPRDATDRCCLAHDCCYAKLNGKCRSKTDIYKVTFPNGGIECGPGTSCETKICECDKAAALCMRDNLNTYNKNLRFYSNRKCNEGPRKC